MEHSSDDFERGVSDALGRSVSTPLHENLEPREAVCPEHGAYIAKGQRLMVGRRREFWSPCEGCTTERVKVERDAAEIERKGREFVKLEEMLGRAAIPRRFIGRSFDNYRTDSTSQRAALTAAHEYAEGFGDHARSGESLLLLGKAGTGKSHLASAILQAIMPTHCGFYTTASELISMVRETWRRDSERSQPALLRMLAEVPLLVIDEVGVQYGTESEQNILFQVLDTRYRSLRPVILMANLNPAELQKLLGDRVFDRLREISKVVLFDWDSYRSTARRKAGMTA